MATTDSSQRSGELARAKIIDIAFEHFARDGYRGSSLGRIAGAAGISQSGLLHHFPSKAALLQAVLATRDVRDMESTGSAPENLAEMDFAALLELFEQVVRHNAANRDLVRLAHLTAAEAVGADHPAHEWVTGRQRFLHSLIEAALTRDAAAGSVRPDVEVRTVTDLLIAAMEGLENQWLLDPEVDMVGSFRRFCAHLRVVVAPAP
ncbi:TetR/AcrR family transcriptional regulator [Nocardia inohanensis]|uniref:TetR/AcrR family transcriptional regulator n=1 Tax=Nocardia inohanensis TaxID=209246 RepID=UPI0008338886|nr:TetR/AcrR family transcriptional regulator [Nocardia inohanensis]